MKWHSLRKSPSLFYCITLVACGPSTSGIPMNRNEELISIFQSCRNPLTVHRKPRELQLTGVRKLQIALDLPLHP